MYLTRNYNTTDSQSGIMPTEETNVLEWLAPTMYQNTPNYAEIEDFFNPLLAIFDGSKGSNPNDNVFDITDIFSMFLKPKESCEKTDLSSLFDDGDLSDADYEKISEAYEQWAKAEAKLGRVRSATLIDAKENDKAEIYQFCMANGLTNNDRSKIWDKTPIKKPTDPTDNDHPKYAVATAIDNAELNGEVSADEVGIIKRVLVAICKEDSDEITEADIIAFATGHELTPEQTKKLRAILDEMRAVGVDVEITEEDKNNEWYIQFAIDAAKVGNDEQDKSEKNVIERLLDVTGKESVLEITLQDLNTFAKNNQLTEEQKQKLYAIVEEELKRVSDGGNPGITQDNFREYLKETNRDRQTSDIEEQLIRFILEQVNKKHVSELNDADFNIIQDKFCLNEDEMFIVKAMVDENRISNKPVSINTTGGIDPVKPEPEPENWEDFIKFLEYFGVSVDFQNPQVIKDIGRLASDQPTPPAAAVVPYTDTPEEATGTHTHGATPHSHETPTTPTMPTIKY